MKLGVIRKPDLSHIKVFGCIVYMKVPVVQFRKLDDRERAVVYLGKEPGMKGSRLYDPKTRSVHVNRDVVVQENKFWSLEEDRVNEVVFPESFTAVRNVVENGESADAKETPKTPERSGETVTSDVSAENSSITAENSNKPR